MPYVAYNLNTVACFADTESFAIENLPVAQSVKFGEACTEFKLISVNTDDPISLLSILCSIRRKTVSVDAEKIAHMRLLKFQIACNAVKAHYMNDIPLYRAEYPLKHVIEMHTDISGDAAAFTDIALPGSIIPFPLEVM